MGFIRCTLTEIRRRPVKYMIFTITFSVIFASLILGLNMRATVMQVKEQTIAIIGPYFQLSLGDEGGGLIDDALITRIAELEHVKGVNRSEIEFALAGDFQTVRDYEGAAPNPDPSLYETTVGLKPNSVILDANLDCSLIDDFRLGDSVLISGRFPTEAEPGVLLEQRLAERNGFEPGDTIHLQWVRGEEVKATVVGIYETKGTFTISNGNAVGEAVYAWSPYNRIYASLDIAERLYGLKTEQLPISVYADSVSAMDRVSCEIKALPMDWNKYELVNMTEQEYGFHKQASQIEEMSSYASWIMMMAVGIGVVLSSLILNLFLQYYIREAGILIALGSSRVRTVLQHLAATGLIAIVAALIAVLISALLSERFIGKMIRDTTLEWGLMGTFENGLDHVVSFVPRWMTWEEWGMFILGVVLLLTASSVPLLWRLVRFCPRSVLAD